VRYLTIIIFVFLLNMSLGVVNVLQAEEGLFATYSVAEQKEWGRSLNDTVQEGDYAQADVSEPSIFESILDVAHSFYLFVKTFAWGVIYIPGVLRGFGIPGVIANLVAGGVWLLYLMAIAQWIGNKQTRGMD
jgi:hypothetical protein